MRFIARMNLWKPFRRIYVAAWNVRSYARLLKKYGQIHSASGSIAIRKKRNVPEQIQSIAWRWCSAGIWVKRAAGGLMAMHLGGLTIRYGAGLPWVHSIAGSGARFWQSLPTAVSCKLRAIYWRAPRY